MHGMESFKIRQVCPTAWNNVARTGWIFMKFDIWVLFRKYVEKIQE